MKLYFNDRIKNDAIKHAREEFPNESCGIVVDGKYKRCENIYKEKDKGFKIDKHIILEAYQSDKFECIIHSHCNTERPWASGLDIQRQENSGVPWGIVDLLDKSVRQVFFWGDSLPVQDLEGRPFIHGIYDCYGIVRDYYRMKGLEVPNFPRDWGWWEDGENTILDGIESSGCFKLIPPKEIQPGDAFVGKIKFKYPNHCGVYLGNGIILHHWAGRRDISCKIPYNTISQYIIYGVRYEK